MCDFSLQAVKSRPAKVGDKLTTKNFGSGTRGFAACEDSNVAVCVLPGTEIAFDDLIASHGEWTVSSEKSYSSMVAIFRQINKETKMAHHDALELPNGQVILLTAMKEGQTATVLQLPAAPKNKQEEQDQKRLEIVA